MTNPLPPYRRALLPPDPLADAVIDAYVRDGLGFLETVHRLRAAPATVRGILASRNITLRSRRAPLPNRTGAKPMELPMEEIEAAYAAGASLTALGKRYGVHYSTIERRLKKRGRVKIRGFREAALVRLGSGSPGDVEGLAAALEMPAHKLYPLLVVHGFVPETRQK
jgi:hypothetical protein